MSLNKKHYLLFFIGVTIFYVTKLISACNQPINQPTSQLINQPTNQQTKQQTNIGKYLFFDRKLSINNTRSCGTCHNPQFAFTDGYKRSLGAFADLHQRNTEPIFNLKSEKYFTAADSSLHSVLEQMDNPLFNIHPIEMGVGGHEDEILQKIATNNLYKKMFKNIGIPITWSNIKKSIALFVSSISSYNSPYDKYINGDSNALNASQINGKKIFFSSTTKCSFCHSGINFSSSNVVDTKGDTLHYFNTGLYNIDKNGSYPPYDKGLLECTNNEFDMGKYKVPTLRNVAFTAPYAHDGSVASLSDVIDNYKNAGRNITTGIYKGNGKTNKFKHSLINGFNISETEKLDLICFLLSLSDSSFIKNPAYQNPFTEDETKK